MLPNKVFWDNSFLPNNKVLFLRILVIAIFFTFFKGGKAFKLRDRVMNS